VIFFFFRFAPVVAQTFKIQELTVADGLSQGMILPMLQDKQGFMWFATRGGLDRYDGYRFKHFTNTQAVELLLSFPLHSTLTPFGLLAVALCIVGSRQNTA
jgi:ligand-binding sensor domain-containing protein